MRSGASSTIGKYSRPSWRCASGVNTSFVDASASISMAIVRSWSSPQTIIEARFIVHEIVLSCWPQKIVTIYIIDVPHSHSVLAVHMRVICQPGEKELYLMRYACIETFINSIRNTRIYLYGRIRS